jgi:hypothetical protein
MILKTRFILKSKKQKFACLFLFDKIKVVKFIKKMTTVTLPVSQIPNIFSPNFRKKIDIPEYAEQVEITFTEKKQAEKLESTGEVFNSWEDFMVSLQQ